MYIEMEDRFMVAREEGWKMGWVGSRTAIDVIASKSNKSIVLIELPIT